MPIAVAAGVLLLLAVGAIVALSTRDASTGAVDRFMHVHGLAIPAWAPDSVYLSTHQGLIRIDDGGEWHHVSEQRHDFMGFAHDPERKDVFFSSGHPAPDSNFPNPIGFMRSEDGGVSWRPLALQGEVDFHAMAVSPADPNVIYGWNLTGAPGLYRSSDDGRNWDRVPATELAAAGGVFALAPHPTNPAELLAGTRTGLWRSVDGGERWERVLADVPVTALHHAPDGRLVGYLADGSTGMAVIDDAPNEGGSIRELGLLLPPNDAVVHLAVHPERGDVIVVGTAGEHLLVTRDGGASWQQIARAGRREPRAGE